MYTRPMLSPALTSLSNKKALLWINAHKAPGKNVFQLISVLVSYNV